MKIIRIYFILIFFIISCKRTEQELIGIYTPISYENNFDTIQLMSEGKYKRKLYDINNKLVLKMEGNWLIDGNSIKFTSFFLNLDDDLISYPELLNDTLGGWSGDINKKKGIIKFCVGYFSADLPEQNCYQKIE